jgi:glycosyltransferase involved in cell wall biosynthesis
VHSIPDFEVFAAVIPKLTGCKVVLDIHDIVPELYAAKFGLDQRSTAFRALAAVERMSASFADHVIVANELWWRRLTSRSTTADKCTSLINYPDASIFHPGLRTPRRRDRFLAIYPGTLNWHQGLDIAIRAVALAKETIPGLEFHVYGDGPSKGHLEALVAELGLDEHVRFRAPLPLRTIASVMADADLGIVPKRNDSFGGEAFSTKILEFMALGVPVVVADTPIDRHYFSNDLVKFFAAGDSAELAHAMSDAYRDRARSAKRAQAALEYVRTNNWGVKRAEYLTLVGRLVGAA